MAEPGHDGNAPAIRRNEHSIPRLPVNRNFSRRQNPFHARFRGIGSGDTGRSMQKSGGHYAGILRHRRREVISQHTHMHFPATENSWQSGNNRNFRGRNMSLPAARQALTTGFRRFSGNVRIFLRGSQVTTPASIRKTDSFVEKHVVLSTPSGAITEASRLGFD